MDAIDHILETTQRRIAEAADRAALEQLRVDSLGKKGELTQQLKLLKDLDPEIRPLLGQRVNQAKQTIAAAFKARLSALAQAEMDAALEKASVDITLPGRTGGSGGWHPISRVFHRLTTIFHSMGFAVREGPEVEDEYHNFTALNIPEHHPARAEHDTFYLAEGGLLRTHTSPVQIRTMVKEKPPLRIITPGRVYRCDSDQTHTPMFHQLEGLLVDEYATFADLKGLLQEVLELFFEKHLYFRFRPSYFPFTAPSAEVDIACVHCEGVGCRICGHSGWLEVLGCGMVHPRVLAHVNIDSEHYQGFAFGMGIDRLAMLRYQIDDLRLLFQNNLAFLEQF